MASKMPNRVDGSLAQQVAEHGAGDRRGAQEGMFTTYICVSESVS